MKKAILFAVLSATFLTGCVTDYSAYYKLDDNYLERRQTQTRAFETADETALLVASSQVLQDLGFTITESNTKLGLISAKKDRDATNGAQITGAVLVALLTGVAMSVDTSQTINATLVSTKRQTDDGYNVRVEFSRIIYDSHKNARIERISDPTIYQEFFDKLSQSTFLTANDI